MVVFRRLCSVRGLVSLFFLATFLCIAQNIFASSTLTGIVFDKSHNAISNVDVELLNDYYQQRMRTRTDGAGRYSFENLPNARYWVRVSPFWLDLEDQMLPMDVDAQTIRGGEGSGFFNLDFYLVPKKGGIAEAEAAVVFVQDVPAAAKKLYSKAIDDLANNRTNDGIIGLNAAVQSFPTYFQALSRLGKELFIKGKYLESGQCFMQAVTINPKSASSFYYLGYSLSKLGKDYNKAALAALNQGVFLAPSSSQILFILGKVERAEGNFSEAEKHLLLAKKSSKVSVPDIHKELAQLYSENLKKFGAAADELELYLKSSKLSDSEEKSIKKIIAGLRDKATKS